MNEQSKCKNPDLATALSRFMERKGWKDLKMATKANKVAGRPELQLSRSTVRNWRKGEPDKVSNWRGLLAIGMALELNINEINQLLLVANQPNLSQLYGLAEAGDKRFFTPWHNLLANGFHTTNNQDEKNSKIRWANTPIVSVFYGRQAALETVMGWIVADRYRLVGLLGAGGIGKTHFTMKLASRLQDTFDYILGVSLNESPPLEDVVDDWLGSLLDPDEWRLEIKYENKLDRLLYFLQKTRCLLILDNLESVMEPHRQVGGFRAGYENYGRLLEVISKTNHQGCLLFTSRESPKQYVSSLNSAKLMTMEGLDLLSVQRLLCEEQLVGTQLEWRTLKERCGGNPHVLRILSQSIQTLFNGQIGSFLQADTFVFNDVYDLLAEQFERLSEGEKEVLFWLMLEREAITLAQIAENLLHPTSTRALFEIVASLHRRSLIRKSSNGFMAENLVKEFLTDKFLEMIGQEIIDSGNELLNRYALLKTNTKEYIRTSQKRIFFQRLAESLITHFGNEENAIRHLADRLTMSRKKAFLQRGYFGGNIINLLIYLGADMSYYDLSWLALWHGDFRGQNLAYSNLSYCDLMGSAFTQSFTRIHYLAFDATGALMALGTADSKIQIWHLEKKRLLHILLGHHDWIRSVLFLPDGKRVASCADDGTIRIWDLDTGQCVRVLRDHQGRVLSLALITTHNSLASGGEDHTIRLWDLDSYQCHTLLTHENITGWVLSAAYDPNSGILVGGDGHKKLHLWDIPTGKYVQMLHAHEDILWCVAFSPNGRYLASSSYDQTIALWDTNTRQQLHMMCSNHGSVRTVVFSPDNKVLASGSKDGTIQLWNMDGTLLTQWPAHQGSIWCLRFDPSGRILASGSEDKTAKLWDVHTQTCLSVFQGYSGAINSISLHPNNRHLISGGEEGVVRLWDIETGRCLQAFRKHETWLRMVAFSPNGRLFASGGSDGTARIWEPTSGAFKLLNEHRSSVQVAFSSNGRLLATGSHDKTVRIWDTYTGECLSKPIKHHAEVLDLLFHPINDQLLFTACADANIRVWNLQQIRSSTPLTEPQHLLKAHTNFVWALAINHNTSLLASGSSDHTIRLWDTTTMQLLPTQFCDNAPIRAIALSPDGKIVASGGFAKAINLWQIDTGKHLHTLSDHTDIIWSLKFSKDGKLLISGSHDETIKVWDIHTGQCIQTLKADRPYENTNIAAVKGLTSAQRTMLADLGAIDTSITNYLHD